jgi:hypothetical protein
VLKINQAARAACYFNEANTHSTGYEILLRSDDAALETTSKCSFTICKPHLRHVTGEASRLREQMQAILPAQEGFNPPCQNGRFFAGFRLA